MKPVVWSISRAQVLLALLLLLSVSLVACGDNTATPVPASTTAPAATLAATTAATSTAGTTTAATTAASTTAASATSGPITVTDGTKTTITIDKPATRVICVIWECYDVLLELGVTPVGVFQGYVDNAIGYLVKPEYFGKDLANIGRVGGETTQSPNLEDIAKLKPDLVLGSTAAAINGREGLKNIAPIYALTQNTPGTYDNMFTNLRDIGKLTGREAQAEAAIKRFQDKLTAYKAKSPKTTKVLVLCHYYSPPGICVMHTNLAVGAIMKEVTAYPWDLPAGVQAATQFSLEKMLEINPDVIFVGQNYQLNPDGTTSLAKGELETRDKLKSDPFWSQIAAVKNGKVFELERWEVTGATLALGKLLDDVMTKTYPDVFPQALP